MKNGYILNKREVISFLLECRTRHCNFVLQIDFSNSDNSDQIPSIERMERTETISPRGSYIGCPRILSCFSPSRPIMTTKKKKEKIQIEERGKIEIKLRNVNKRKNERKEPRNRCRYCPRIRSSRESSTIDVKERGREENGTKGRKGHPSKTRRSFRTNSTTTDESLLACLLAQFPGMETGTIMIYIYYNCRICICIYILKNINTPPFPVPLSVSRVFVLRIRHEDVHGKRNE